LTYGRPTARKFEEILRDIIRRSELVGREEVRLTVREPEALAFDDFLKETMIEEEEEEEEEDDEEDEEEQENGVIGNDTVETVNESMRTPLWDEYGYV
jgi:hypothetical protein